LYIQVFF